MEPKLPGRKIQLICWYFCECPSVLTLGKIASEREFEFGFGSKRTLGNISLKLFVAMKKAVETI